MIENHRSRRKSDAMVETESGLLTVPVIFFDGNVESNLGNLHVFPGMDYKSLHLILSHRIGISAQHFYVYLSDRRTSPLSPRNIPVTNKSNFFVISREKGWVLVVVLKRVKHERPNPAVPKMVRQTRKDPPSNVMILKRNDENDNVATQPDPKMLPGLGFATEDLGMGMRNLQMEKQRYLKNMDRVNPNPIRRLEEDAVGEKSPEIKVVCQECTRGERGFHPCVNDPVVYGFRLSPVDPITRPENRSENTYSETPS